MPLEEVSVFCLLLFVQVFYVDYGNRASVALDHLREIPAHLQELPFQVGFSVLTTQRTVCGGRWGLNSSHFRL